MSACFLRVKNTVQNLFDLTKKVCLDNNNLNII